MSVSLPPNAFSITVPVTAAEVDHNNHVSNMVALRLINDVSLAQSQAVGWDIAAYHRLSGAFVVRRHEIDYRAMAFLGDRLMVSTWVVCMERARAERRQLIVRESDQVVIAEARNLWTFVNLRTGRPQRIPDELLQAFGVPATT